MGVFIVAISSLSRSALPSHSCLHVQELHTTQTDRHTHTHTHTICILLEKWFPLKSERGSFPIFFIQPSPPFISLLSCSFYLLDQRTFSGVEILKMTGKTAQSYYVLTTATFQAYRRLTVKCVQSRNVPI